MRSFREQYNSYRYQRSNIRLRIHFWILRGLRTSGICTNSVGLSTRMGEGIYYLRDEIRRSVTFHWLNQQAYQMFTVHSDLGRVVQAIIREFCKYPPQLQDDMMSTPSLPRSDLQGRRSPSYNLQRYSDRPSTSYNSFYNSSYPQFLSPNENSSYTYNFANTCLAEGQQFGTSSHHTTTAAPVQSIQYMTSTYTDTPCVYLNCGKPISSISIEFPELHNLSNEELKKLGEEEDSLDNYLEEQSRLKDLNLAIDAAIDYVEKVTTGNLTKEIELKTLQEEVISQVQSVSVLKARYDSLINQYNKLSEVFIPDHIKECLKSAADESHEKSEKIAEDFLNRKIDVERFLSTYIKCRKLGQARRTKEEKLAHQLNELKRAGY
ncbi:vacuolar protein sorting-associated protein 37A isoform X3 [Fopius arisanus]|uniref:Vacuolar protein sorting-associated protein 37A isoform X3 n=1 Tax=Fopius arisanus TaxID=64838 RepID=A0A9R1SUT0_9HYME|nr:PREDICTED: vacuolar protein sorting-associated protein 37A isoform X3 [Fopius arisanus]